MLLMDNSFGEAVHVWQTFLCSKVATLKSWEMGISGPVLCSSDVKPAVIVKETPCNLNVPCFSLKVIASYFTLYNLIGKNGL